MTLTRRSFMVAAAAAATTLATSARAEAQPFKTKLQKALLAQIADEATCERIAKAGFPGVELMKKDVTIEEAQKGRKVAEKFGLKIHSFMGGWANFNNPDPVARQKSIDDVKRMIRLTAAYGADAMLLVPCRTDASPRPKPEQFKITFDEEMMRVLTVVEGDNEPYKKYITEQNRASALTQKAIAELLPVAKTEGVTLALENVWNNLWITPDFAATFIRSFNDKFVRAYLDLGNYVRYAKTEDYLRAFGPLIVRLHIKDFLINRNKANDGDFVPIGKGSIDWVSVRKVIDEINYSGWVSIEDVAGWNDAQHSTIMDNFFAGKGATL